MVKATYGTGCFALPTQVASPCIRGTACSRRSPTRSTAAHLCSGGQHLHRRCRGVNGCATGLKLIEKSSEVLEGSRPLRRTGTASTWCRPSSARRAALGSRGPRAILALTRDSGPGEIAAATLDSVCYQTRDLLEAMRGGRRPDRRAAGRWRMVVNDPLMQRLADTAGTPVRAARGDGDDSLGAAPSWPA